MRKLGLKSMVVVAGLALGASAFAADMKVGIINVQQIFASSPKVAKQKAALSKEFGSKRAQLKSAQQKLREMVQKYKRDASVMSASQRQKVQTQIAGQQASLGRMSQEFQGAAMRAQRKAMKGFVTQVRAAAKQVAKEKGLTLIVAKNAVLYSNSDLDVTNQVSKILNK